MLVMKSFKTIALKSVLSGVYMRLNLHVLSRSIPGELEL